jgi:hypothetical protein
LLGLNERMLGVVITKKIKIFVIVSIVLLLQLIPLFNVIEFAKGDVIYSES